MITSSSKCIAIGEWLKYIMVYPLTECFVAIKNEYDNNVLWKEKNRLQWNYMAASVFKSISIH